MPKFSVSGIWKRWRDSYPSEGEKADLPATVFTGVSFFMLIGVKVILCEILVKGDTFSCDDGSCRSKALYEI